MSGAMPPDMMRLKERLADGGAIHDNLERTIRQGGGAGDSIVCNIPSEARSAVGFAEGQTVNIAVFADGILIQPEQDDSGGPEVHPADGD